MKSIGRVEVYLGVGLIGIAATALGIAAEVTRIKLTDINRDESRRCIYPKSPSATLANVAALLTLIVVIVTSIAARFGGCAIGVSRSGNCNYEGCRSTSGITALLLSWILAIFGIMRLLSGAAISNKQVNTHTKCYTVRLGIFAYGALMSLFSCVLGLIAYGCVAKTTKDAPADVAAIAMGSSSSKL